MIFGMSTSAFTLLHVLLSLVGIFTGLVVVFGMFRSHRIKGWTGVFLATTVLTGVTGYFFPAEQILPSHVVGALSLVVLAIAIAALYIYHLAGSWRWIYIVTAVFALYLNVFVGVVQAFLKIPFLKALAPTQDEPPFVVAQAIVLVFFVTLATLLLKAFHPKADTPTLGTA
jgi:hypothetical protein